ncbi:MULTISPECIES: hypothetical protein [unclassified Microbacterium]|uniref:hypothetical protein n=1 Tax=unclassified Microbacterium TaxID=2609290 RepID=UPI0030165C5B
MTESTDELKGIGVAEMRAAVQASGTLEGIEGPDFLSPSDVDWRPYFRASDDAEHPEFARVTVTRVGQRPRNVVISWAECEAEIESEREQAWADGRRLKPMSIFGAEAERHAYRVVFADILEPIVQARKASALPAMPGACGRHPQGTSEPCAGCAQVRQRAAEVHGSHRDWLADLAATSSKAEVDALFEDARQAKALKDATLHEAFTRRLREVLASPKVDEWEPRPTPNPTLGVVPSPAAVAAKSKPLTVQAPRRPQGDRPQGQRRKAKR